MFKFKIKVDPMFKSGKPNIPRKLLRFGLAISAFGLSSHSSAETQRDYVSVVGSSTVYPFATSVAERIGKAGKFKTPRVESTSTGSGIKKFCHGVGTRYPDIVNASRPMKKSELDWCEKFGVKGVMEVKIGYDGIVVATVSKNRPMKLTRKDLFLALAKVVPDPDFPSWDKLVDNPYKTWNQINPAFPNFKIKVMGPPQTAGTRDAFAEMALEGGCQAFDWIKVLKSRDEEEFKSLCQTIREDGVYTGTYEDGNLIVQKLRADPTAIGIFGYNLLAENMNELTPAIIDGVNPDYASIYSMRYPLSRPLYVYVKKFNIPLIPGLQDYIAELISERASGKNGYLIDKGLIPLTMEERQEEAEKLLTVTE